MNGAGEGNQTLVTGRLPNHEAEGGIRPPNCVRKHLACSDLLEAEVGIEQQVQFSLLQFYYPTARGVQRHNYRMTVESGLCSSLSSLFNSSATLRTLLSKNSATGTFTGTDAIRYQTHWLAPFSNPPRQSLPSAVN